MNSFLKFYGDGYELSASGEIVRVPPDGLSTLIQAKPPSGASDRAKVINAVRAFHLGKSNREQRKQAVRDLVDVLEYHRQAAKVHLTSQDEQDLFNVANNFALRHHRVGQKDDYDDEWLTWLFYMYLATVHLILGRVHGFEPEEEPTPQPPITAPSDDDIPF